MHFIACYLQLYGIKIRLPIGQFDDKMKEKQKSLHRIAGTDFENKNQRYHFYDRAETN